MSEEKKEYTNWDWLCSLGNGSIVWNKNENEIYVVVSPFSNNDGEEMGAGVGIERLDLTKRGFRTNEIINLNELNCEPYRCNINELDTETKVAIFLGAENVIQLTSRLRRAL